MNKYYDLHQEYWRYVGDVYDGVIAVKSPDRQKDFLPPIPSELEDDRLYEIRLNLAHFENAFRPLIDAIVGIMQKNPPKVKFGVADDKESPLEVLELNVYGNASEDGLSGLKWRLNHNQALFGRYGLLLDINTSEGEMKPHFIIQEYPAEKILDGETGRWALLDESTEVFDEESKDWKPETRWRVLGLDESGNYYTCLLVGDENEVKGQWQGFDLRQPGDDAIYPNFKGALLDFIPLTVCNAKSLGIDSWEKPPYFDAANTVVDAYRSDSFYRKAIANHATPTLVIKNGTTGEDENGKPVPPKMGGVIYASGGEGVAADVDILETGGSGLNALRESREDILNGLKHVSLQYLLDGAGANSSGEAIQLRMLTGTASIAEIDLAGEKAIEEQLCFAAYWAGATWEEVGERISYEVDTSYAKTDFTVGEVVQLLTANATIGLLSKQALYEVLRQKIPTLPPWEDNEAQRQELEELL